MQQLSYRYGQNGLLLTREDARGLRESFDYDLLQRLTSSTRSLGGQVQQEQYRYDGLGNLLQNPQFAELHYGQYDAAGQTACTAQNGANPGPHAVLRSSAGYYCYDARGNQLSGPGREVSYSLFDKPLRISSNGQHSDFRYDPERRRYLQVADNRITVYLDEGRFEEILDNGQRWQNSYIGGYLQVQRDPASNQLRLNYQLQDQLGSLESVTDASGALVEKRSYAPFGGLRGADWSDTPAPLLTTRRGFTDHEHLSESGLIHMNGRVYDPSLGRFLSADIVYQDTANAQMFNRYAYGFNSPFAGVDPTGYALEVLINQVVLNHLWANQAGVGSYIGWGFESSRAGFTFGQQYMSSMRPWSEPAYLSNPIFGEQIRGYGDTLSLVWPRQDGYRVNPLSGEVVTPQREFDAKFNLITSMSSGIRSIAGAVGGVFKGIVPNRNIANDFLVAKHGDMPSPRPGQHSHHGVISAWMGKNFPRYNSDLAPAVLMPEANHRATFGVFNRWKRDMRVEMGGVFDWSKIPEQRMLDLSERMFDAAKVPAATRQQYWDWYSRMKGAIE